MVSPERTKTGKTASWVSRHAALLVGGGAFVFAWALWAPLLGRNVNPAGVPSPDFLILALAGGMMPSFAALVWRLFGGRLNPDVRAGLERTSSYPAWLGACLILTPVLSVAGLGLQIVCGIRFEFGNVPSRLALGLAWPVMASLGEEFGWRGVLLPALRGRFGLLGSALLVGAVWGLWHLPVDWIGLQSQGAWFWPQFLIQGPVVLTAHSLIIAWLWMKTGGRTLTAIVYHFGITASAILLSNQAAGLTGSETLAADALAALPLVALSVVAGVSLRARRPL